MRRGPENGGCRGGKCAKAKGQGEREVPKPKRTNGERQQSSTLRNEKLLKEKKHPLELANEALFPASKKTY